MDLDRSTGLTLILFLSLNTEKRLLNNLKIMLKTKIPLRNKDSLRSVYLLAKIHLTANRLGGVAGVLFLHFRIAWTTL